MKYLKTFLPLCLIPCASLLIVSGCGSGDGTSSIAPIVAASATPTPISSPCSSSVTAVLTTVATSMIPEPRFQVAWTPACGVDEADIIEYHVFRDNVLIGVTARSVRTFYDGTLFTNQITYQRPLLQGEAPFTAGNRVTAPPSPAPYNYRASIVSGPGLAVDVAAVSSLTTASHQYEITVVFQRSANSTLEYVESPIGVSPFVMLPSQ